MKNNRDRRYPVFHVPHVGGGVSAGAGLTGGIAQVTLEFRKLNFNLSLLERNPFPVYADTGREMNGTMGGGAK